MARTQREWCKMNMFSLGSKKTHAVAIALAISASVSSVIAEEPSDKETTTAVLTKVEALVKSFYPKAKIKKTETSIHFEFKAKPFEIPPTNKVEPGPDWGGIVGDITQKSGHLKDEDTVEKKLNQYSYYHVMELRPNISSESHLEARLAYPFDINPDFMQQFKTIIRGAGPPANAKDSVIYSGP